MIIIIKIVLILIIFISIKIHKVIQLYLSQYGKINNHTIINHIYNKNNNN